MSVGNLRGVETQRTNVKVTGSSKFVDEKMISKNGFQNAGTPRLYVDFQGIEYAKK